MKRLYFTLLCVVLSLSGCVQPDNGVDTPATPGHTTIKATTAQLQLTLPLTQEVLVGSNDHVWSTGNYIGAFGSEGGKNAKYTLFNDYDGAVEGLFYGAELKGNIYAYYPYSKDATAEGSKVALTIPDTQTYDADLVAQFEQNSKILVAKSTDGNVALDHLYGCLGISIKGNFTVQSITLTSANQPLAGRVAFDFENDMEASAVARSLYSLTLDCGAGVQTSEEEPATLYVMLPPATYSALSIEIVTSVGVLTKKLNGAYTVKRVTAATSEEQMSSGTIVADFTALTLGTESEASPRTWTAGAEIGIFSENSKNTKFSLAAASAGKAKGEFVGAASTGNVLAYYPYSANATLAEGVLTLTAKDTQLYNSNLLSQFITSTPFMVAQGEEGADLSFEYVMGVVGVRVSADVKVKYITLTSAKPLAGKLLIDTANGYACSAAEVGTKSIITLDASAVLPQTSMAAPQTFYLALPVGEYDDLDIAVTTDDGSTLMKKVDDKVFVNKMELSTLAEDITYQTIDIVLEDIEFAKSNWSAEDYVAVYDASRGKLITSQVNVKSALQGSVVAPGMPEELYNLVYPASAATSLDSKAVVTFPVVQNYNAEAIDKATHIYVGRSQNGKGDMYLLSSILGVTVSSTYADCKVTSVTVTSKSMPLTGVATVDMSYEERPVATLSKTSNKVQLVFAEPIVLANGESRTFYIAVPAGSYPSEDLSVAVSASLGATVITSAAPIEAAPAALNELSLSTIKCTNLTAGEKYANCFVLPNKKGWYMFDARSKGGYTEDEDGGALITETAIAGTLFELNSGMITNVNVCNDYKSVSFYYDGSVGNASIATIDNGMVLWAWHLWCPGAGQPKDIVIGSNTYFDRNLGSLKVPTSKAEMEAMTDADFLASGGMLYQWGRPSPFPYAKDYTNEAWANRLGLTGENTPVYYYPSADLITVGGTGGAGGAIPAAAGKRFYSNITTAFWTTNAAATKSPLYIGCQANNTSSRHWNQIWSMDPSHKDASWNYSDEKHKQYDPCPYGYELPQTTTLVADIQALHTEVVPTAYLASSSNCKGGYYIERENGEFLWHAVSGLRYNYGLWGTLSSPNANLAGATNDSKKLFLFWGTSVGARDANTGNWAPATAMGVRCIKK